MLAVQPNDMAMGGLLRTHVRSYGAYPHKKGVQASSPQEVCLRAVLAPRAVGVRKTGQLGQRRRAVHYELLRMCVRRLMLSKPSYHSRVRARSILRSGQL